MDDDAVASALFEEFSSLGSLSWPKEGE